MKPSLLDDRITLKHGAGGRAMRMLIEQVLLEGLSVGPPHQSWIGAEAMDDGAAIRIGDQWLVLTTDSHVVQPAFFPGGDIGRLAVCGTVNDLAVMGAVEPLGLTCAIVVEEGFEREVLVHVHESMRDACREAGTTIVTGDTKVMGRGEVDGIVINTTGVGLTATLVRDNGLRPGDVVIVTGTIGDHGLAVMAIRHQLGLDGSLRSDVAPINRLIAAALEAAPGQVHALKDPTRGGLASTLHEMADKSRVGLVIEERRLPISEAVRGAAELLGIDPLHVANEGKAVLGVAPEAADVVLEALRAQPLGRDAAIVGRAVSERPGVVVLDTGFGRRLIAEAEGEPLPRIC
jgi:hydrogenase expression/formation protein HypE